MAQPQPTPQSPSDHRHTFAPSHAPVPTLRCSECGVAEVYALRADVEVKDERIAEMLASMRTILDLASKPAYPGRVGHILNEAAQWLPEVRAEQARREQQKYERLMQKPA